MIRYPQLFIWSVDFVYYLAANSFAIEIHWIRFCAVLVDFDVHMFALIGISKGDIHVHRGGETEKTLNENIK